jgi:hypothetical protein
VTDNFPRPQAARLSGEKAREESVLRTLSCDRRGPVFCIATGKIGTQSRRVTEKKHVARRSLSSGRAIPFFSATLCLCMSVLLANPNS